MRILFFGDVVGRAGRECLLQHLPKIRDHFNSDFVIVNGENAAHGFGISPQICDEFFENQIDVITTGNHAWDQRQIMAHIETESRLLRPANFPQNTPGRGAAVYQLQDGRKILVANAMGRVFMDPMDDPFAIMKEMVRRFKIGTDVQAIIVDFHAEANSEKMAMGHFLDGAVSLVVGTHTHVPTADAQILPNGTAYLTDAGMCGDYDSVIGMEKEVPIHRFTKKTPSGRFQPASGEGTACGVFIETDDKTGLAKTITPFRVGGRLQATIDG